MSYSKTPQQAAFANGVHCVAWSLRSSWTILRLTVFLNIGSDTIKVHTFRVFLDYHSVDTFAFTMFHLLWIGKNHHIHWVDKAQIRKPHQPHPHPPQEDCGFRVTEKLSRLCDFKKTLALKDPLEAVTGLEGRGGHLPPS